MDTSHHRSLRLADMIHRELANILQRETQDPRFKEVSVTTVEVAPDLSFAKVYVSMLHEDRRDRTLTALNKASGFFRHALAVRSALRVTPQVRFFFDASVSEGSRLSSLIDAAIASDQVLHSSHVDKDSSP